MTDHKPVSVRLESLDILRGADMFLLLFAIYWAAFALKGMNVDPQENVAMTLGNAVLLFCLLGLMYRNKLFLKI